jgi:hypothetical protein
MARKKSAAQLDREIAKVLDKSPRRSGRRDRDRPRRKPSDSWLGSKVQSLLFARPRWTPSAAKVWAHEHGYRSGKVHATDKYIRLRQFTPVPGTEKRTITFGDGIRAVIEQVK